MRTPSPAFVIAVLALFVALGGTTYAATSLPRNSVGTKQLKNGAVTAKKMSKATVATLKAGTGSILTFDADATASPSKTTLGTALGDTWAAECVLDSGHADLLIFLKTIDGSWSWQLGQETNGSPGTANALYTNAPAGTFSVAAQVGEDDGGAAPHNFELEDQGVQLAPVTGYLTLHVAVLDTTAPAHTCHLTISATPEKVTKTSALGHLAATNTPTARIFGNR